MADIYTKINEAGRLLREISDEIGYTVRLSYRQPDGLIGSPTHSVMIEGDLPNGHVYGLGGSPDKAMGEALARLEDALGQRLAA